jgi:hypothetical protein
VFLSNSHSTFVKSVTLADREASTITTDRGSESMLDGHRMGISKVELKLLERAHVFCAFKHTEYAVVFELITF